MKTIKTIIEKIRRAWAGEVETYEAWEFETEEERERFRRLFRFAN